MLKTFAALSISLVSSSFYEGVFETASSQFISQIDVLMHPVIDEPFGPVIIEAMAMEKPAVAYKCGGPREIIVNNQTGYLVKPYNFKALSEKGVKLLNNKELQKRFGKAGRIRVVE